MVNLIITFKELVITDIQEDVMDRKAIMAHIERRNPDIKIDEYRITQRED